MNYKGAQLQRDIIRINENLNVNSHCKSRSLIPSSIRIKDFPPSIWIEGGELIKENLDGRFLNIRESVGLAQARSS